MKNINIKTNALFFNESLANEGDSIVLEALGNDFKGFIDCPKCKRKDPKLVITGFEHRFLKCNEVIGKTFFGLMDKRCHHIFLMDEEFFDPIENTI